jgi:hypothetical protein
MYVDPDYADADPAEVRQLVAAWPLATVIATEPELRVAHAPVQLRTCAGGSDELVGHVAAADPIAESPRAGSTLLSPSPGRGSTSARAGTPTAGCRPTTSSPSTSAAPPARSTSPARSSPT